MPDGDDDDVDATDMLLLCRCCCCCCCYVACVLLGFARENRPTQLDDALLAINFNLRVGMKRALS